MSANLDLAALASETASKLSLLWDELGVSNSERQQYLETLAQDVAMIYSSRVEGENNRKFMIENEIQQLQTTIENLIRAMDDASSVVSKYYRILTYIKIYHLYVTGRQIRTEFLVLLFII